MPQPAFQKENSRRIYDRIAEAYEVRLAPYSSRYAADLIDLMFPQHGEAALDIAGGTGAAGLKLAARVGKKGSVTIVDTAAGMLDIATRKAADSNLSNVRTLVMDAENLDFPDSSFDLVTCCMGVMYFRDVAKTLGEARRVLKPQGRIGFTVWSVPARFPLYAKPMTLVIRHMAPFPVRLLARTPILGTRICNALMVSSVPPETSAARFGKKGSLEQLLAAEGFVRIRRELRAYPLEFSSFDDYWNTLSLATPMRDAIEKHPIQFAKIRLELRRNFSPSRNGGLLLFNESGLVLAAKSY
jgi:ubiquinone/menaquinone biosynthesis C-methylase UbiE